MMVQLLDKVFSLVDVKLDVLVRHPDLDMQERHIVGVPADGVKDDLLVFDIMCSGMGKRLIQ